MEPVGFVAREQLYGFCNL